MPLTLTENAARRITALVAADPNKPLGLRMRVRHGGCSGNKYEFSLAEAISAEDDAVFQNDTAKLVIDLLSLGFVDGGELDYVETLAESAFRITNPNAVKSCHCGKSFGV